MPNLTQIYNTEGMWGSWELLKKFTLIGYVVQFFLTVYGFLSLVSALLRVSTTIFYLSNRRKFDEIDRVQEEGLSNAFKSASGFNKLIVVIYCLLPNIKQQSDADSAQFNLSEDDSIMTYIMKSAPSTIAIIVFSSMAFTGLLFQIYANISNGFLAVAEQARDLPIAKAVTDFFESGKDYGFTLNNVDTPDGQQLYRVARTMYADVISRLNMGDATGKANIGSQIEASLMSESGVKSCMKTISQNTQKINPKFANYLKGKPINGQQRSIWNVAKLHCQPAQMKPTQAKGSGICLIGNSNTIYVPITSVCPSFSSSSSFTGYTISVSLDIPNESMYTIRQDTSHTGTTRK